MKKLNKINIILSLVIIIISLVFTSKVVLAQTITPGTSENQASKLANLHTLCDNAITSRITSLNTMSSKIDTFKHLTSAQQSQYTSEISSNISALNTLKASCDADTVLSKLRSDYHLVFTNYRIYAVFERQINRLRIVDQGQAITALLTQLTSKLQTRIQQDNNPANLTALLSDMQAKVQDANTQFAAIPTVVSSITPASYNSSSQTVESEFKTAITDSQTAASDIKAARSDAASIIQGLKAIHSSTNTTITPTQAPAPSGS